MATAPATYAANDGPDEALESETGTAEDELAEVFERAQRNFDLAVLPQLEQRSLALMARRFVSIPGAQWEGDFGEAFANAFKPEINLTRDGLEKIYRDYNENRIVPDFRPAGGKGDDVSAQTLDGLHRADSYCFKSQQARDNAAMEAFAGGFGAYRLTNEWADSYDTDSDHQRINPASAIVDADQRVFFDPDSKLYDKSDARYCFVITAKSRQAFEEEYDEFLADWPEPRVDPPYDWFTPDTVKVAEYYEVEDANEKLLILTHALSGEERRYWQSELDTDELAEMKKMGWVLKTRSMKRKSVHKYVISGAEVLADKGAICGDRIPVVPVYGKRSYVDGIERFVGYVQDRMDRNRLYNMAVARLQETSAMSPREKPIFLEEQVPPHIADLWSRQEVERHGYAIVRPVTNPLTGEIVAAGPIGKVEAPQVDPATAAILQLVRADLTDDQQDGADEVKANTSADAMDIAATRVDAKSGIYLDNFRQSVQCEGEIYLSMAPDVYFEPGRTVETMAEDGNDGTATLVQPYTDNQGAFGYLNDFSRGHYKVVVDVTEATATRRDKTVKSCINTASVAAELGDNELAQAALITAIANQDGEGMTDLQKFARARGIQLGLIEPTDEEAAQLQQQAQEAQQQPNPQADLAAAKAQDLQASAGQRKADALLKVAQATAIGGPDAAPKPPDGLEQVHKIVQIRKTAAEAANLEQDTAHMPQKLAIEATNAAANRLKAVRSAGPLARFRQMFTRGGNNGQTDSQAPQGTPGQ